MWYDRQTERVLISPSMRVHIRANGTFFLRICGWLCPSWNFPSRSGKDMGLSERERGVLVYWPGSWTLKCRLQRTEHRDRERRPPEEWRLFSPIMTRQGRGHQQLKMAFKTPPEETQWTIKWLKSLKSLCLVFSTKKKRRRKILGLFWTF